MGKLNGFNPFQEGDLVTYNNDICRFVSEDGDKYIIHLFKENMNVKVDKNLVSKFKRCVGLCDKRVIGDGDNRVIKCFGCDRTIRRM